MPNGRRLEDDVMLIELQAVAGVALAAIGRFVREQNARQTKGFNELNFNLSDLPSGLYFINFTSSGGDKMQQSVVVIK